MSRIVTLMVLLSALAPEARAENKAVARESYRKATQDYNLGEYKQALEEFKNAYRNFEDPSFLFNIGQCHRMLGDNQEALRSFRAYLRERHDAPNRVEVEKVIASLESLVREQNVSRNTPPQGTLSPPATPEAAPSPAPEAPPVALAAPPPAPAPPPRPAPEKTPTYKKWWVWTLVVVAAAGVGVGLGVGLTHSSSDKYPTSNAATDGTFHF